MAPAANINARVAGLTPYQPGKPIEELTRELGISDVVKLASNENPRGPGPAVRAAVERAATDLSRYPDGSGYRLKRALGAHLGVPPEQITLGNGSNDVLELAARVAISPGTEGIVDAHGFVVYPLAVAAAHGQLVTAPSRDWSHDLDAMLDRVTAATRIVFLANPNNPTGTWVRERALTAFLRAIPESVWVVLDEAYCEYVSEPDYPDGIRLLASHPNLIVTRTFSKLYGIAGRRIGYGICGVETAERLRLYATRSNPNTLAVEGALGALDEDGWYERSLRTWDQCEAVVTACLDELELHYFKSHTAFLFHEIRGDQRLYIRRMEEQGILVGRPFPPMLDHNRLSLSAMPEGMERFNETLRMFRRRGWV